MALNSSGPISLAGPIAGQSIALTILQSPTGQISLNDTNVRTLSGVTTPNSQITMPGNFWGKAWHATSVDFFMMGGGGTNGANGGGGGGGQMVGQNGQTVPVSAGVTYPVTVGGAGSISNVFGYNAIAGGNGGGNAAKSCGNGGSGACGGGAGVAYEASACSGGAGIYGGNGGNSAWAGYPYQDSLGGGGGGLGGNGSPGSLSYGAGNGGSGIISTFTGAAIYYGGGAGGAFLICTPGVYPDCNQGANGSGTGPNTGGGNSSGVVIIRVSDQVIQPTTTGSPQVSYYNNYYWYKFTGSGTITF